MPEQDAGRRVLVAGATGLVGRECMLRLAADPGVRELTALVRHPPAQPPGPGSKVRFVTADFQQLDGLAADFAVNQVFCALGTTIAKAGSRAEFRRVDLEYPLAIARLSLAGAATHFLLVSALGADPRSLFFYSRIKGELEEAILAMPWRAVTIVRPSLLLGERGEFRLGEELAKGLGWAVPRQYRPVHARDVAAAMVAASRADRSGKRVIESSEIKAFDAG